MVSTKKNRCLIPVEKVSTNVTTHKIKFVRSIGMLIIAMCVNDINIVLFYYFSIVYVVFFSFYYNVHDIVENIFSTSTWFSLSQVNP